MRHGITHGKANEKKKIMYRHKKNVISSVIAPAIAIGTGGTS